ncbi:MAG: hypothetical protein ACI9A0_002927, partial [Pseudoalteromonas tetraodonis]
MSQSNFKALLLAGIMLSLCSHSALTLLLLCSYSALTLLLLCSY